MAVNFFDIGSINRVGKTVPQEKADKIHKYRKGVIVIERKKVGIIFAHHNKNNNPQNVQCIN